MSGGAEPTALPDISAARTSLMEVARSNTPRSPPLRGGDELPGCSEGDPRSTSGTSPTLLPGRRTSPQAGASPRAATAPLYLPRPPSTSPLDSTTGKLRKVRKSKVMQTTELYTHSYSAKITEPGIHSPVQERVKRQGADYQFAEVQIVQLDSQCHEVF